MPAIQPARLKIQAAELAESAHSPQDFCRAFHEFLEFYSDRTYRPGLVGEPRPLIRAFNVPKPVLTAVSLELTEIAENDHDSALKLVDALWSQSYLEFKILAAHVLGKVDPMPTQPIISRIDAWITPRTEERLVNAVIRLGLDRLRVDDEDEYFRQIDNWLQAKEDYRYRLGLKAIRHLISEGVFEDIPLIFRRVGKAMRNSTAGSKSEILELIRVLAEYSPQETAHFLRETLFTSEDVTDISWYVRHSLDYFPPDNQAYLRSALKSNGLSSGG